MHSSHVTLARDDGRMKPSDCSSSTSSSRMAWY